MIGRREIIFTAAGAGLSALFSGRVTAKNTQDRDPLALEAGLLHRKALDQTYDWFGKKSIIGQEGLKSLIAHLPESVINKEEKETQDELVQDLYASESLVDLEHKLEKAYNDVQKTTQDAAIAIAGIAYSSVLFVKEKISKAPMDTIVKTVASDIQGALSAAGASGSFPATWRIAIIVGGAVSSSVLAFFGNENKG